MQQEELVLCWVETDPFQEEILVHFYAIIFHYDVISCVEINRDMSILYGGALLCSERAHSLQVWDCVHTLPKLR
jgi:hypothetical protein